MHIVLTSLAQALLSSHGINVRVGERVPAFKLYRSAPDRYAEYIRIPELKPFVLDHHHVIDDSLLGRAALLACLNVADVVPLGDNIRIIHKYSLHELEALARGVVSISRRSRTQTLQRACKGELLGIGHGGSSKRIRGIS